MPYLTFKAQLTNSESKAKKAPKPKKTAAAAPVAIPNVNERTTYDMTVNILAIGRNTAAVCDFISSMNDNLSDVFGKEGLTCYTNDNATLSSLVARKKAIERHFWEFNKNDFVVADDSVGEKTVYSLTVSPSGMQNRALDMIITCAGYQNAPSFSEADAVWLVADGAVLDDERGYDGFREYLKSAIRAQDGKEKPACLVLSQIEGYGRYEYNGGVMSLPYNTHKKLLEKCREHFSGDTVAVVPVQVYGGLEYVGTPDGEGLSMRISDSGYYQSFIPEGCWLVPIYTVERLMRLKEISVFEDIPGCSLRAAIKNSFAGVMGDGAWSPDIL